VVFFYRWVAEDKIKWLWLAGAAVLLAGLTKGIAGGFFLPGIGLWLLLTERGRRRLLRPALYLIIGGAIVLVVSYYFARNAVDPVYLEMVRANELGGRFVDTNEGHRHPGAFACAARTRRGVLFLEKQFGRGRRCGGKDRRAG